MSKTELYSPGKIMLTGEYLVLKGAESLSIPIRYGQSLLVEISDKVDTENIIWDSFDHIGYQWLDIKMAFPNFTILKNSNIKAAVFIKKVLEQIHKLNPHYFQKDKQYKFETELGFNQKYGLGSSSTLIANLANLCQVNPFELLKNTISGSGYDVAVALEKQPIIYSIDNNQPTWNAVDVDFPFEDEIYFLYLGKKQSSEKEVKKFNKKGNEFTEETMRISEISYEMIYCKSSAEFCKLMDEHEGIMSGVLDMPTVKSRLFSDFAGSIKSLGAWGGDLVMVCTTENPRAYFNEKGFETLFKYGELVK